MTKKRQEPSGNMTNNMEDLVYLGKQMERMRDGKELEEDERYPDPIQFDEEEKQKQATLSTR